MLNLNAEIREIRGIYPIIVITVGSEFEIIDNNVDTDSSTRPELSNLHTNEDQYLVLRMLLHQLENHHTK